MSLLDEINDILEEEDAGGDLLDELRRLNDNLEALLSERYSQESIQNLEGWFEELQDEYDDVIYTDEETDRKMLQARKEMQRAYIRGVTERSIDAMVELEESLTGELSV